MNEVVINTNTSSECKCFLCMCLWRTLLLFWTPEMNNLLLMILLCLFFQWFVWFYLSVTHCTHTYWQFDVKCLSQHTRTTTGFVMASQILVFTFSIKIWSVFSLRVWPSAVDKGWVCVGLLGSSVRSEVALVGLMFSLISPGSFFWNTRCTT